MDKKLNYVKFPGTQFQRKVIEVDDLSGSFDNRYVLLSSSNVQNVDGAISFNQGITSNGNLILSSSGGSIVYISSSLEIQQNANIGNNTLTIGKITDVTAPAFIFYGAAWGSEIDLGSGVQIKWANTGDAGATKTLGLVRDADRLLRISDGGSGTGSILVDSVFVSGSINSINSHLILTSSFGSIVKASASFLVGEYTSATLPAGSTRLSGAIVYVTDKKALSIYGPQGWVRLLSGTL